MAFKRIVAKSEQDLEKIIDDVRDWFSASNDYDVKFSKETRKFMDPESKKIVEKSIDVIEANDKVNDKRATIKFIPMNEKNEMKLELGGEGESVVAGKISNQMKGRGTLKSYSKDKKVPLKENKMKKSELKQLIKEEINKMYPSPPNKTLLDRVWIMSDDFLVDPDKLKKLGVDNNIILWLTNDMDMDDIKNLYKNNKVKYNEDFKKIISYWSQFK